MGQALFPAVFFSWDLPPRPLFLFHKGLEGFFISDAEATSREHGGNSFPNFFPGKFCFG